MSDIDKIKDNEIKTQLITLISKTYLYVKNPKNQRIKPYEPRNSEIYYITVWDEDLKQWIWRDFESGVILRSLPNDGYSWNLSDNAKPEMLRKVNYEIEYVNDKTSPKCQSGHPMIIVPTNFIEHLGYSNCYCDKCMNKILVGKRWCCPQCKFDLCYHCISKFEKDKLDIFNIESCDYEISNQISERYKNQLLITEQMQGTKGNLETCLTKEEMNKYVFSDQNECLKLSDFRLNMSSINNWFGLYINENISMDLINSEIVKCPNPYNIDLEHYDENGTSDEDAICSIIAYGILTNNTIRTCKILEYQIMQFISYDIYSEESGEITSKTGSMIILYFNCLLFYCKERVKLDLIDLSLELIMEHEFPFTDDNILNEISIGLNSEVLPLRLNITEVRGFIPHFMSLASTLSYENIFEIIESSLKFWGRECLKLDTHMFNIKERFLKLRMEKMQRKTNLLFSNSIVNPYIGNEKYVNKKIKTDDLTINTMKNYDVFSKIMLKTIYSHNEIFIRKKVFILSLVCKKWWKYFINNTPFYGKQKNNKNLHCNLTIYCYSLKYKQRELDEFFEKSNNFSWN
jgi:hypothetical protein